MSHMKLISSASRVLTGNRVVFRVDLNSRTHFGKSVRAMSSVQDNKDGNEKVLNMKTVNPNITKIEYAVRGPLVIRAGEIEKELEQGTKKPFNKVIKANIGDAHAMQGKPVTFIRQVLSCVVNPHIIPEVKFPEDVKKRACDILQAMAGNSAGAYTVSYGIERIRRHVAQYIEKRDGHKSDWNNIVLTNGASTAIKNVLQLFINEDCKPSGIMIPIPQYPLYSAAIVEYGLQQVGYYLDEEKNWGLDICELERSYEEGSKCNNVRAIVIINPGNPTGQVLSEENIKMVIKFAKEKNLFILADEVYQDNVYGGNKFFSFKKMTQDMGKPYSEMELASFMSASKGYMSECGLRGGWMELVNMDKEVQAHLYKAVSAMLCANTVGQAAIDCIAIPPKQGEPSYDCYVQERTAILKSLEDRGKLIVSTFNKMEGFKCNNIMGAMYAFPKITMPAKAIEKAKEAKQPVDVFYAFRLLEETGICVVPGSGFGQKPGTWHFRTTVLPQPKLLKEMLDTFQKFHAKFTKEFS